MADEVHLNTFTVTLVKQVPVRNTGPGVALKRVTFEEARRAFHVDLPPSLAGGLTRTGIAIGDEAQPFLVADYEAKRDEHRIYLSYILIPANVYEPAPDGRLRYMVLADSMQRRVVAGNVVAMASQDRKGPAEPGSMTAIWEKEGLLALAVAHGMSAIDLEAAVQQIA